MNSRKKAMADWLRAHKRDGLSSHLRKADGASCSAVARTIGLRYLYVCRGDMGNPDTLYMVVTEDEMTGIVTSLILEGLHKDPYGNIHWLESQTGVSHEAFECLQAHMSPSDCNQAIRDILHGCATGGLDGFTKRTIRRIGKLGILPGIYMGASAGYHIYEIT